MADNRSDDEYDYETVMMMGVAAQYMLSRNARRISIERVPCRTSSLQGAQFVTEVLRGHPKKCYENFRMQVDIFEALCQELRDKYMLRESNNIQIPEMVAMFLFILGQGACNRLMQEIFQHSGETVSRIFRKVLKAVMEMVPKIIKPRENQFNEVPARIRTTPELRPFKNAIGAIDGTHIQAVVGRSMQLPFINIKGFTSHNVLAACDFDMLYLFVAVGYEGSAHDARVLQYVQNKADLNFPHPPAGKYYLVDAGYANKIGYLTPYKGEQYHLSDWRSGRRASGPRELFNHKHSSLRNVIERTFGVTKKRWKLLTSMTSYPCPRQADIVIACCALHNYIRMRTATNEEFEDADEEADSSSGDVAETSRGASAVDGGELSDDNNMSIIRDRIARQLYHYRMTT